MTYPVDQTKYKTLVIASGLKYIHMYMYRCMCNNKYSSIQYNKQCTCVKISYKKQITSIKNIRNIQRHVDNF